MNGGLNSGVSSRQVRVCELQEANEFITALGNFPYRGNTAERLRSFF